MAEIAELEYAVGGLASLNGGLRLRDNDILVVKHTTNALPKEGASMVRENIEAELRRLGIAEPKVLVIDDRISLDVIELT